MTFDNGRSGPILVQGGEQRAGLVGYLPVGYPSVDGSLDAFRILAEGCDVVEVGMPYSDPVMDGPTVADAANKALQAGVRTRDLFKATQTVADAGGCAVVMSYWNIIEHYGVDKFARDLAASGGVGVITPDLTPDEADEWVAASDAHGLDRIFLVSPSSTEERIKSTVDACRGWLYATSVMGVTGMRAATSTAAPELVARIRALRPEVLIGIGLGVSNAEQAHEIGDFADGVIVGSALVKQVTAAAQEGDRDLKGLRALVEELALGVRR